MPAAIVEFSDVSVDRLPHALESPVDLLTKSATHTRLRTSGGTISDLIVVGRLDTSRLSSGLSRPHRLGPRRFVHDVVRSRRPVASRAPASRRGDRSSGSCSPRLVPTHVLDGGRDMWSKRRRNAFSK